jgi:hypothetical protein
VAASREDFFEQCDVISLHLRLVDAPPRLISDLEHYGTSVPAIRAVAKGVRRRDPEAAAVLDRWPAAAVRGFPGAAVTALRR